MDLDTPISERIIRMTGGYWIARLKRAMTAPKCGAVGGLNSQHRHTIEFSESLY